MEFGFNVNALFRDPITVVTADFGLSDKRGRFPTNHEVQEVIDAIGERSAHAQNLSSPITTWSKLRINKHTIYLLTDPNANNGHGQVQGFIKIGRKQLFVLDRDGTHNEIHPLCVLDFYIHESQQRKGHGLKLFKHMLHAEDIKPAHLAIDRPSSKFISFLRKHFNLWATIPQVNNFVVFDGFFKNRKDRPRPSRKTNKDFEDDFRPLSRAFSEDVIRRNRRNLNYNTGSLNGIRPMSGLTSSGSGDHVNAAYTSPQVARANRFSRFAIDENYYVPSSSHNRRRTLRSRQDEEIITNPYKRVPNTVVKARDAMDTSYESDSKPLQEIQPCNEEERLSRHKEVSDHSRYDFEHSREKADFHGQNDAETHTHYLKSSFIPSVFQTRVETSESKEVTKSSSDIEGSQDTPEIQPYKTLFEAKVGYNSLRNPRYEKPSDMVAELKRKDLNARIQSNAKRNPNGSLLGTSWNLFGVPSPSIRRWQNQ